MFKGVSNVDPRTCNVNDNCYSLKMNENDIYFLIEKAAFHPAV